MFSILNIVFAWLSLAIIVLLCSLFPISKLLENKNDQNHSMSRLKYYLKKLHKPLGVVIIFIMLIHGRLSGQRPGIEAILILLISIMLLCSYCLRRKLPKGWKKMHLALTVFLLVAIIIHLFIAFSN